MDPRIAWRAHGPARVADASPTRWRSVFYPGRGGRGCIAPWTWIYLPLEDRHERVDVLAAAKQPVNVLALARDGPRVAMTDGAPFAKGITDLYEVTTDDGRKVTVTTEHRFLTPRGWLRPAALCAPDRNSSRRSSRSSSVRFLVPVMLSRRWSALDSIPAGSPGGCPTCPVLVIHDFLWQQVAAEHLLHHEAMLADIAARGGKRVTGNLHENVPVTVDRPAIPPTVEGVLLRPGLGR